MAIQGNTVQALTGYEAQLASLPDVTTRKAVGDGQEPQDRAANDGILTPAAKTLADASPTLKFQTVEQLVRSQDRLAKNRWAIDTHFRRIRAGVPFSRLEKIPNQSIWVAKLPNGMSKESSASVPNKADDLCNKVEDTLMADPAKPRPQPRIEDEAAERAADLLAEFLTQDGEPSGTNDVETFRWGLNNAFTGASSFLHYIVDRSGGGYQPLQKLAHPQATDPANPLEAQIEIAPASIDPITGVEIPAQTVTERTSDPILRYVSAPSPEAPDGQFVENAADADRVWLPKLVIERLRREHVRCYPPTATAEDAEQIILVRHCTLAEGRKQWPKTVGAMTAEQLQNLASWRPALSEHILPYAFRSGMADGASGPSLAEVGSLSPLLQRRMFSYRLYVKACPEYPEGYWCDVTNANGGTVLDEGTLEYTVTLPAQGQEKRCRDIPVVQIRPMQDVDGCDPMGWPFISRFAGSSEAEATLYAAFMDLCDNMLHPHVFIRSTTEIDEDEWFDRSVPIVLSPDSPEPTYEKFPTLPPILQLIENLDTKQDTSSGLTATAQGLDSSNAVSGVAKNLTMRQALISLSGFQQNLHAGMTRGWRIKGQIVQAEWTTPQLIQTTGEEGSAEPQWWTGENLAGVDRVGIQPGTGTMMTPEGKAQYVAFLQSQAWMQPDQAAEVALPGIRMDLGLPEDPFKQAIERRIANWLKGPTEEWTAAEPQYTADMEAFEQQNAAYQAESQMAAAAGMAMSVPAPEPPAPIADPFPALPNDDEPTVAAVYMKALGKLFVDPKFSAMPVAWQQYPIQAYLRARQALAPAPVMVGPDGKPMQPQQPQGVGQPQQPAIPTIGAQQPPKAA